MHRHHDRDRRRRPAIKGRVVQKILAELDVQDVGRRHVVHARCRIGNDRQRTPRVLRHASAGHGGTIVAKRRTARDRPQR